MAARDIDKRASIEEELEVLAGRVAAGDVSAIDDLALALKQFIQPYVQKALRGLKAAADDAEDLLQDVWIECYRVVGQYNPARGKAAAYFGRVAFQAASYKSRGMKSRTRLVLSDPSDPQSTLSAALDDLPQEDPETLVMVRESVDAILDLIRHHLPSDLVEEITRGGFRDATRSGLLSEERAHQVHLARRRARRLLRRQWPDLPAHLKASR